MIKRYGNKLCSLIGLGILCTSLWAAPVDLFDAIGWEKESDFKEALDRGGNPNQVDPNLEISILMRAIESMKPELVKMLLKAKADVNLKIPKTKKTALMHFMEKYIQTYEDSEDGSAKPVEDESMIKIFQDLVQAGAKFTDVDSDGKSVMSYAFDSGYALQSPTILKAFLDKKVDPNSLFSKDIPKSFCYLAVEDQTGRLKLAWKTFLKENKCNPNLSFSDRNYLKTSFLFIALHKKDIEDLTLLLEAGANPNVGASDTLIDYIPLFMYIEDFEITKLLLKHKANPNSIENGIHIMEHAARTVPNDEIGESIIDLLLQNGSEINHPKLFDSYTPYNKAIHAAHIVGKYRIQKYLESKGAKNAKPRKQK